MLDELTYRNHLGEEVRFGREMTLDESDLRDAVYEASRLGRSLRLSRAASPRRVRATMCLLDDRDGLAERDRVFDVFDADSRSEKPGAFVAPNGWELRCVVSKVELSRYLRRDGYVGMELSVEPLDGCWTLERRAEFRPAPMGPPDGLDLPLDMPFDFGAPPQPTYARIDVTGESASFLMRIWGPAHNPEVRIAGNLHAVDVDVPEGARLEIDGRDGTVVMTAADGTATNCLAMRRTSDGSAPCNCFKPVPAGEPSVEWDGSFWFELMWRDERSSPRWLS